MGLSLPSAGLIVSAPLHVHKRQNYLTPSSGPVRLERLVNYCVSSFFFLNGECYDTCNESSGSGRGGRVSHSRRVAGADDDDRDATKAFEVLAVDGNLLVVNLPEGTRELKVADDFRFMINGKPMSVRELTVGMKGTATITTATTVTPVTVTEVKNGTVQATSGTSIIVRTPEGIKSFTQGDIDKRGVKIMRNGKPAGISDFRTGDNLSATIITSRPPTIMTQQQVDATLAAAKPAAPPPAAAAPAPAPAAPPPANLQAQAAPQAPRTLPSTASSWPTLALASIVLLMMGLTLTIARRFVH